MSDWEPTEQLRRYRKDVTPAPGEHEHDWGTLIYGQCATCPMTVEGLITRLREVEGERDKLKTAPEYLRTTLHGVKVKVLLDTEGD